MTLPDYLIQKLEAIAQRENRTSVEVLESLIDNYENQGVKAVRRRIYDRARAYWQQVGDEERAAMTDEALDEQFWFIDAEGVPHLKSEEGQIERPKSPLRQMADAALKENLLFIDSSEISKYSREILQTEYADYLLRRMKRDDVEQDSD